MGAPLLLHLASMPVLLRGSQIELTAGGNMPPRTITTLLIIVSMASGAGAAHALQPNPQRIGMKPVLGWSSWSSFRGNSSAAKDEAVARAMVSSGLASLGYRYINQDDGWYVCHG